ncbi:MAG: serine hydrolase domain-containing protein [Actinomycetota bacterium]
MAHMGIEVTASPESVGMSSARLDRIGSILHDTYVEPGEVAGISTLVARRGEIVHASQIGHRDREAGLAMTDDTLFRIYSMTKPIVSTALMLLHEEARFQLEQPVATFLPAFGAVQVMDADGSLVAPVRPIEVRDLLTHTSGLTYDFMVDNPVAALYREARIMNDSSRSLEACIDALAELPLAFQPGSRWHYSVGIDVAARLIEVLSGQSLAVFLHERIFGPLGMSDTAFGVPDGSMDRVAAMYGLPDLIGPGHDAGKLVEAALTGDNQRRDVTSTNPADQAETFARGGLGLFSTIGDYHRFAQMLANGGTLDGVHVMSPKTLELMHTNHLPPSMIPWELMGIYTPGMGFGLGSRVMVDVAASRGPGSVGEFGWAGAAKTYYWVDPTEQLVGIFMSQYMTGVQVPDRDFRSLVYGALTE